MFKHLCRWVPGSTNKQHSHSSLEATNKNENSGFLPWQWKHDVIDVWFGIAERFTNFSAKFISYLKRQLARRLWHRVDVWHWQQLRIHIKTKFWFLYNSMLTIAKEWKGASTGVRSNGLIYDRTRHPLIFIYPTAYILASAPAALLSSSAGESVPRQNMYCRVRPPILTDNFVQINSQPKTKLGAFTCSANQK